MKSVFLGLGRRKKAVSKQDKANRYRRIGNVKGWPDNEVNKVGNIAKDKPVNEIADSTTKNQAEGKLAQPFTENGKSARKKKEKDRESNNDDYGNYGQGK